MKREAGAFLARTDDKKARWEAGLDLDLSRDITDLQVENILKEVSAPPAVKAQITELVTGLTDLLSSTKLKKSTRDNILAGNSLKLLEDLSADYKFSGGKVSDVTAIGPLSTGSLVFPNAFGNLTVNIALKKPSKGLVEERNDALACLSSLASSLRSSNLVDSANLLHRSWSDLPLIEVVPALPKLKQHLKIQIDLSIEGGIGSENKGISASLQQELNRLLSSHANYQSALQLMEIWTRQLRCLLPVSLLPVVFLNSHLTNIITPAMKPWQTVRRLWTFISESRLPEHQIILGVEKLIPSTSRTSPFLDRDGTSSLFPAWPVSQWHALASWAEAALNVGLKESLLVRQNLGALYDNVVVLKGEQLDPTKLILDLEYALGDRVLRLSGMSSLEEDGRFTVGLGLNPSNYCHPATQGPQSDQPNAAKFREFWGERSELRRFQDGVVREVVVWGNRKDEVIGDLVRAVVARHHPGIDVEQTGAWHNKIIVGDGGSAARAELDVITPILYGLEGLPLTVSGVAGFGEEIRLSRVGVRAGGWRMGGKIVKEKDGAGMLLENAGMAPPYITACDVMLQAEHSGKWPKEESAVRRLRVAWLSEVGAALAKKMEGLNQRLVGEHLMVVTPSKEVVFRFFVGDKGRGPTGQLCTFASWLGGVAKSQPAWSGGVRLAKRWVAAHLLADSVTATAVEVIMAKVFLNPAEFGTPPVSEVSAFYRWLQLVSSHDWNEGPVIVDPDMVNSEKRSELPPLAVITPHDPEPSHWTKPGPSWTQLQRLVSLAAAALDIVHKKTSSDETELVQLLFSPVLDSYEFLINLKPLQVPNRSLNISNINKPEVRKESGVMEVKSGCVPVVEFSPAHLLQEELSRSYGHLADFFLDKHGGTVIAVKIKQKTKSRVKVSEIAGHMSRGLETEINWGAVVEDWETLGDTLIKNIVCKNDKLLC